LRLLDGASTDDRARDPRLRQHPAEHRLSDGPAMHPRDRLDAFAERFGDAPPILGPEPGEHPAPIIERIPSIRARTPREQSLREIDRLDAEPFEAALDLLAHRIGTGVSPHRKLVPADVHVLEERLAPGIVPAKTHLRHQDDLSPTAAYGAPDESFRSAETVQR